MAILISPKNVWGTQNSGLDLQRSDLWVVDISAVLSYISLFVSTNYKNILTFDPDVYKYLAQSVSFPEVRTNSSPFLIGNTPVNMPDYTAPIEGVRIVFNIESGGGSTSVGDSQSNILGLLEVWNMLVRIGRGGLVKIPPGVTRNTEPDQSSGVRFTARYAFDIGVAMLKGNDAQAISSADNFDLSNADDLQYSYSYILSKAWLSAFQVAEIGYGSSTIHTVTATIIPAEIYSSALDKYGSVVTNFNGALSS